MLPDINCDMGEGINNEEQLMPFITSANIACGYHAGDIATMQRTIELCLQHHVAIGAHPSFYDKENFGRTEWLLPAEEIYELVTQQLYILYEVADSMGAGITHVKPHGALYNLSARDENTANVIARAIQDFDPSLMLFGLSGSYSISQAQAIGLKAVNEVFADRTYSDDGSLTPRSLQGALIENAEKTVAQVMQMINKGTVTSITGKELPIKAGTICIHGDGKNAVELAKAIYHATRK
jgi:5-oxoprolinase (ATP-hydrolysing) subunit A